MTKNLPQSLKLVYILVVTWTSFNINHSFLLKKLLTINYLFNLADSGEQQESGGEAEEDDMQQRHEASTSQPHGLFMW